MRLPLGFRHIDDAIEKMRDSQICYSISNIVDPRVAQEHELEIRLPKSLQHVTSAPPRSNGRMVSAKAVIDLGRLLDRHPQVQPAILP